MSSASIKPAAEEDPEAVGTSEDESEETVATTSQIKPTAAPTAETGLSLATMSDEDAKMYDRHVEDMRPPAKLKKFLSKIEKLVTSGSKRDFKKARQLWIARDPIESPKLLKQRKDGRKTGIVYIEDYYLFAIATIICLDKKPTRWELKEALNNQYLLNVDVAVFLLPDCLFVPECCANCNAPEARNQTELLRCSGCKTALYCGASCQLVHWSTFHRKECAKLTAAYREAENK